MDMTFGMVKKVCCRCNNHSTFTAIITINHEECDVCPECFVDFMSTIIGFEEREEE